MKTIKFSGHSDDLVHVTFANGETDERGPGEHGGDSEVFAKFVVGGRIVVTAIYCGVWSFAAGQADEGIPFPDWPLRIVPEHEHSVRLEIDVPDECASVLQVRTP